MTDNDITYDEIIAAIEKAVATAAEEQEPGTFTTTQYAEASSISSGKALKMLKEAKEKGIIKSHRFTIKTVHELPMTVYGWKYVGGSNDN